MSRKTEISRKLQKRAERMIPGGVNSPVRAFRSVGGEAPFIVRGEGAHMFDADGNEYIDYIGSWGPLILGHAAPTVVEAVQRGRPQWHQLWRFHAWGGRLGRTGSLRISAHTKIALRQFGHGSDHVGHSSGPRLYQA